MTSTHIIERVTAEIYAHMIHGQDDDAVRAWEEYRERNRARRWAKPGLTDHIQ